MATTIATARAQSLADIKTNLPKLLGDSQYKYLGVECADTSSSAADNQAMVGLVFRLLFDCIRCTTAYLVLKRDNGTEWQYMPNKDATYYDTAYKNAYSYFRNIPIGKEWKEMIVKTAKLIMAGNKASDLSYIRDLERVRSGAHMRKALYNFFEYISNSTFMPTAIRTISGTYIRCSTNNNAIATYTNERYEATISPERGQDRAVVSVQVNTTLSPQYMRTLDDGRVQISIPANVGSSVVILASGSAYLSAPVYLSSPYVLSSTKYSRLWSMSGKSKVKANGLPNMFSLSTIPGWKFDSSTPPKATHTLLQSDVSFSLQDSNARATASVAIPNTSNISIDPLYIIVTSMSYSAIDDGAVRTFRVSPTADRAYLDIPVASANDDSLFAYKYLYVFTDEEVSGTVGNNYIKSMRFSATDLFGGNVWTLDEKFTDMGALTASESIAWFRGSVPQPQIITGETTNIRIYAGTWEIETESASSSSTSTVNAMFTSNRSYTVVFSKEKLKNIP